MGGFGDKFRKAREGKDLSFDKVSSVLKITPKMLKAIEEEQFDVLPGGVFNKGFIRSYAKHLGLDPEECVSEYTELMRQSQIAAQQSWVASSVAQTPAPASKPAPKSGAPVQTQVEVEELPELQLPRAEHVRAARKSNFEKPPTEIPWRLIAVALLVIVLAAVLWIRHSRHRHPVAAQPAPAATPSQPVAPAPAAPTTVAASASGANPANAPAAATTSAPETPPDANDEKNDVTVRNFGTPLPKASQKAAGPMTLVVRAEENSWISVISDGQLLTEETLIAPAHATFHASREFVIKVGNAGAVSFLFNGKEVSPQGTEGEVKTLTFNSETSPGSTAAPKITP